MMTLSEQLNTIERRIAQMADNTPANNIKKQLYQHNLKLVYDRDNNGWFSLIIQGEFPLDNMGIKDSSPFHPFPNQKKMVLLERGKGLDDSDDILFESKGLGGNRVVCRKFRRILEWIRNNEYNKVSFDPWTESLVRYFNSKR